MSPGSRSGVNWARLKSRPRVCAKLRAARVLPRPGEVLHQHVAAGEHAGEHEASAPRACRRRRGRPRRAPGAPARSPARCRSSRGPRARLSRESARARLTDRFAQGSLIGSPLLDSGQQGVKPVGPVEVGRRQPDEQLPELRRRHGLGPARLLLGDEAVLGVEPLADEHLQLQVCRSCTSASRPSLARLAAASRPARLVTRKSLPRPWPMSSPSTSGQAVRCWRVGVVDDVPQQGGAERRAPRAAPARWGQPERHRHARDDDPRDEQPDDAPLPRPQRRSRAPHRGGPDGRSAARGRRLAARRRYAVRLGHVRPPTAATRRRGPQRRERSSRSGAGLEVVMARSRCASSSSCTEKRASR